MATQRYISTSFWDDPWIVSLEPMEQFLYLYFLTNPLTNIAGVYQISVRRMVNDTKLDESEIGRVISKFEKAGKAFYFNKEFIILPNWPKHQKWQVHSKINAGIKACLEKLRPELILFLKNIGYTYPMDSLSIGNDRQNIGYTYPPNYSDSDSDSDSKIDIEFDGNSNGQSGNSDCEKLVENTAAVHSNQKSPPPNFLNIIKDKVKSAGYYFDEPVIRKIAASIPNPDWVTAKHSIITFIPQKIRDAYGEKPQAEQRKLFASAFSWKNIHEEYTDWLAKQIKADEMREIDRLRHTPPKQCLKCGTELNGERTCKNCNGFNVFDEETHTWVYNEPFDFSLAEGLLKRLGIKNKPEKPPPAEDIDF